MKLWEYVLEHDERSSYLKWLSERENKELELEGKNNIKTTSELIIKEGYCPKYFDCFGDVKFQYIIDNCKNFKINNQKKCNKCWDREINDEYQMYLKLKEKFEEDKNEE